MGEDQNNSRQAVTVAVTRRIRKGKEKEFEEWLAGVSAAAMKFPGHMGISVIRPAQGQAADYVLVFRYDSREHLRQWEESAERREWLDRAALLTVGEPNVQKTSGLEFWFTSGCPPASPAPPRWKMVLVTCAAIYPLINFLRWVAGFWLGKTSPWVTSLIMLPISISVMTYWLMPWLTRRLAFWLFPVGNHYNGGEGYVRNYDSHESQTRAG